MFQEVDSVVPDVSILRKLLFASVFVPKETPHYWEEVVAFAFDGKAEKPNSDKIRVLLENIESLDQKAFSTDTELLARLHSHVGVQGIPLGVILISANSTCKLCGGKLLVRSDRPSCVTLYTDTMGTVPATQFRKYCQNYRKGCTFTQHYSYHSLTDDGDANVIYDDNWADLPYFVSTSKTAFSTEFLERFDAEILIRQVSYRQQCDIYNYYHKYETTSKHCGHPGQDKPTHIANDISAIEDEQLRCRYPGCGGVIILDGNMKNQRNICAATEAGYIQYQHLPGSIKTGCQLSPPSTSKYCYLHAPRVCVGMSMQTSDLGCEQSDSQPACKSTCEGVLRFITGKKITRNQVYYQVAWLGGEERVTWEPSQCVPQTLIADFEAGAKPTDEVSTDKRFGVINHTLSVGSTNADMKQPSCKRAKVTPIYDVGVFTESNGALIPLSCNTEKDKGDPLHTRTAGILVGMWPCGIVILLQELFTAESKSQVYAALHELLTNYPSIAKSLKYICYDDGCHLRRYARNPVRRELTPCTILLSKIEIVIDKMHMAGHVDKWCHENCDPKLFTELDNVDTEICEQYFSWLSKFSKMTRRMSRNTFMFFLLNLCDLHNIREEQKLLRAKFL